MPFSNRKFTPGPAFEIEKYNNHAMIWDVLLIIIALLALVELIILGVFSPFSPNSQTNDTRFYQLRIKNLEKQLNEKQKVKGQAFWYDYQLPGAPNYSRLHATAASKDFARGTRLSVCTPGAERCVEVVVNDYGPAAPGRILDLSSFAFGKLAPLSQGLIIIEIN